MHVQSILHHTNKHIYHKQLLNYCSQFLNESDRLPLYKILPSSYGIFKKIKVRKSRKQDEISENFNKAFDDKYASVRQRAIFVRGDTNYPHINEHELYYIFPIDDFKFMFSREVTNSNNDYKQVFESILNQFGENGPNIISDLLKFSYTSNNLKEGIILNSEIIIYNIPFYFALRVSNNQNYNQVLTSIK